MNHNRYIPYFLLGLVLFGGVSLQATDKGMDQGDLEHASRGEPVSGGASLLFGPRAGGGLSSPPGGHGLRIAPPTAEEQQRYGEPSLDDPSKKMKTAFYALDSDAKDAILTKWSYWVTLNQLREELLRRYEEDNDNPPAAAVLSTELPAAEVNPHAYPSDQATRMINKEVVEYDRGELRDKFKNMESSVRNRFFAAHNPGPLRSFMAVADDKFIRPYNEWYRRNRLMIDSAARMMFIASAAAVVFHHMGGTEWVKRKIREAFDRPKIYTVQQSNSIGDDKRRAAGQQLVLSPEVQRNVNEIVETLRWYNSLSKVRQKEYKLRGVLFYGPPGTGKTSLARALAHRTGWNLIELMADDFNKIKHIADKLVVLEEMFTKARTMGKTMIFLDELEKLVLDRDKGDSPLLTKMLELAERGDVFIIGATNRYFDIDSAFRRRLRYHVEVKSPTTRMRYQIIDNYINWLLLEKGYAFDANAMELAKQLQGKSGAHIESLVERMRDRARLYGNTIIDDEGEERLVVSDQIVREILIDMGIIEPDEADEDVLDRDAMLDAERALEAV